MTELQQKRRTGRTRTILAAQAIVGKGHPVVTCQVRDLSDIGARVTLQDQAYLPDRFELVIPKKGLSMPAIVRWRQGAALGIAFVPEGPSVGVPDPAARIRQLEAENAELRRRMAEMAERLFAYGDSDRPVTGGGF